ncbi:MAG: hypothetical protein LBL13_12125 [Bacteroidales bacterium]|jgi:hypothetical protein|nr:hypothetical protein [Bacteroidales bacterium]
MQESEGNQESASDKLVCWLKTAKEKGDEYEKIKKLYSVNRVFLTWDRMLS